MKDRTVYMSQRDHLRAMLCAQLIAGASSEAKAAQRLVLSVRQVRRLKRRVRDEGPAGVVHRSRGQPSGRRRR